MSRIIENKIYEFTTESWRVDVVEIDYVTLKNHRRHAFFSAAFMSAFKIYIEKRADFRCGISNVINEIYSPKN